MRRRPAEAEVSDFRGAMAALIERHGHAYALGFLEAVVLVTVKNLDDISSALRRHGGAS